MGNETTKGLSINAKTLIVILLFVNIGFAVKMISRYYTTKDAGYIREKTFHEQLQKRVQKAFGSTEEMSKVVADMTRQKEDAEKVAAAAKDQGDLLKVVNKKLEDAKGKLEEERARLQKQIWELEDALSQTKKALSGKDTTILEIMKTLENAEKENAALKKQIDDHAKTPGAWK